jgi:hypothetical protein
MDNGKSYRDGLSRAAEIAELYADENMRMADDTVRADPILNRHRRAEIKNAYQLEAAAAMSQQLEIDGIVYSSRSHAAADIAEAIRAEIEGTE